MLIENHLLNDVMSESFVRNKSVNHPSQQYQLRHHHRGTRKEEEEEKSKN